MPASIGVNLRVTGHCRQGGRKYMEDFFSVAYQQTEDEQDLEYAFFGIYDGHGGAEAAAFAKEHLMESIIKHKNFWSDNDEDVLRAIKDGYIATHYAMWREQEKWPKTASGLPSTAGTTASVAFIRRGKIYIGHVGDSGIILGYQEPGCTEWKAKPLTKDHKPENTEEMKRIESCGGKVVSKSGVPRVVWNRPRIGHQGPVRRSTPIDEIPFLAVARSLGDLWSYNSQINQFIVSPDPDCSVFQVDTAIHRCLIFGTDGLYNMLSPNMAVHIVQQAERHNENATLSDSTFKTWLNPSKLLVEKALERWYATKMRADNTSVVTLMLDPPGPPRAQVLKDRKKNLPESGLKILTRYDGNNQNVSVNKNCTCSTNNSHNNNNLTPAKPCSSNNIECETKNDTETISNDTNKCIEMTPVTSSEINSIIGVSNNNNYPLKEHNYVPKPRESMSFDPRENAVDSGKENSKESDDNTIQINEISSSNIEESNIEEEMPQNDIKSNLRSSKKANSEPPTKEIKVRVQQLKGLKRKLSESGRSSPVVRKSMRLSHSKKNIAYDSNNLAPCTVAEERLKKLAEDAEKRKQKPVESKKNPKLTLAQKIMKLRKSNRSKTSELVDLVKKKKLTVMVENFLSKPRNAVEEKKNVTNRKVDGVQKLQKLAVRSGSQKQKSVNELQKKVGRRWRKKIKEVPLKTSNKVKKSEEKSSPKKLQKTTKKAKSEKMVEAPQKIKPKQPTRQKSIRKKIPTKKVTTRKNMLRK